MDDTDLAARLDRSIGAPPDDGAPLAVLLAAGHRRVRRRRIAAVVLSAAAVVEAVGGVAVSTSGSPQRAQAPVAAEPTPSATTTPTAAPPEPSRREINRVLKNSRVDYDQQCRLRIGEGTVLQRLEDPYGLAAHGGASVAVEMQIGAGRYWYVSTCDAAGSGSDTWTYAPDARTAGFEAWVDEMAPRPGDRGGDDGGPWPGIPDLDLVAFDGATETLVPVAGVTVLDQRAGGDVGEDFARPGDRTAAAQVRDAAGDTYYVLARDLGDGPQYIAVPLAEGGADLDAFLDSARERYAEGGGGLL